LRFRISWCVASAGGIKAHGPNCGPDVSRVRSRNRNTERSSRLRDRTDPTSSRRESDTAADAKGLIATTKACNRSRGWRTASSRARSCERASREVDRRPSGWLTSSPHTAVRRQSSCNCCFGQQLHIGGMKASLDLAERAGIKSGLIGVDLCLLHRRGNAVVGAIAGGSRR